MTQSSRSDSGSDPGTRRPRRTQAERRAESEREILRAAALLFGRQGYTATTLEQIGREAGYSSALVSLRYGSKEGIVEAILARSQTRVGSEVFEPEEGVTGLASLSRIFTGYSELLRDAEHWMRALFMLMADSLGPLNAKIDLFRASNDRFAAAIEQAVREGQEAGEIRADLDSAGTAFEILAAVRGTTLLWLLDPDNIDLVAAIEDLRVSVEDRLSA
ncbi:MAG: TetR/AcrR family transcriptional regulator [Acidobacteria bacterium]|nr:TetR/AcrR family transcriptional regulator [Acidobacteriota bacterium]